jgi:predicted PurR-regulated permease PerM
MDFGSARDVGRTVLVAALVLLAVWILWRFLPALAWASVLAVSTWPLRQWLIERWPQPSLAAGILTVLVGVVIVGPLVTFAIVGIREAALIVEWTRELKDHGIGAPEWLPQVPIAGEYLTSWWQAHLADPEAARDLLAQSRDALQWLRSLGGEVVRRLITLAFTLLSLFFAYRDGPQIVAQSRIVAHRLFGTSASHLGREAVSAVRATVNGLVLVGLAEGALLGIAYAVAGVQRPVLFGFATAVLASIPLGALVVFFAACITLLVQSHLIAAVLLFLFSSTVVFVADHFIRPALIGMSIRLPFLWILLGIFGGLETFGLVGLFLGPAIISVVFTIWREAANPADIDAQPLEIGEGQVKSRVT